MRLSWKDPYVGSFFPLDAALPNSNIRLKIGLISSQILVHLQSCRDGLCLFWSCCHCLILDLVLCDWEEKSSSDIPNSSCLHSSPFPVLPSLKKLPFSFNVQRNLSKRWESLHALSAYTYITSLHMHYVTLCIL